ncbi:hypothetical protein BDR03DRAFT_949748 [Suillus americanus]|nr:hypothetical protein BDR03DRAFT_949748 [Suillus americanus]
MVGGRQGARGEWTIDELVLTVPGDVERSLQVLTTSRIWSHGSYRYPPDHIDHLLLWTPYFLPRDQTTFRSFVVLQKTRGWCALNRRWTRQ